MVIYKMVTEASTEPLNGAQPSTFITHTIAMNMDFINPACMFCNVLIVYH